MNKFINRGRCSDAFNPGDFWDPQSPGNCQQLAASSLERSSLSTAWREEFPKDHPVVLTYRKHNTCAPCTPWPPGLLRAAKRYSAFHMSCANSYPQGAWKLLGNLCSRHSRSRECSSRCARDAGWGSWRDRDSWVLNLNFTFMRLSLPFAGDEPFQDGPKPAAGGLHLHPSNQGSPFIETFNVQKLSSLRSPKVVSQEIPTVRLSMKEKEKLWESKNIISTVVNVLTICKKMI